MSKVWSGTRAGTDILYKLWNESWTVKNRIIKKFKEGEWSENHSPLQKEDERCTARGVEKKIRKMQDSVQSAENH